MLEVLLAVGSSCGLELVAHRRRRAEWAVPLSAVITGLSIGLLLRSTYPAVFVVAALVAIGSKHLLAPGGRHLWNPSNFGLVVVLGLTQGLTEVTPGQWGSSAVIVLAACGAGALIVFRVRRLALVAAFLVAHAGAGLVAPGASMSWSQTFSASTLIFAFFMLTDPKTSPRTGAVRWPTPSWWRG